MTAFFSSRSCRANRYAVFGVRPFRNSSMRLRNVLALTFTGLAIPPSACVCCRFTAWKHE